MKIKATRNILIIVGMVIFIINLIAMPVMAANTQPDIYVNTNGWWRNSEVFNANISTPIQAAVDDATTNEHIFVYNGTYTENVIVNKQITLQGEGMDKVSVTAKAHDHVFKLIADQVDISGFTIIGAMKKKTGKAGVFLGLDHPGSGVDHCVISNNNILNNHVGIFLVNSNNDNLLTNNNVSNNWRGVYLAYSANNTITDNIVHIHEKYGIHLASSDDNTLTGNTITSK